jgi:hypothetical protein
VRFAFVGNRVSQVAYRWQYCEDFPDPRVHLMAIKQALG